MSYFRGSSHDFRQYFGYFFFPKRIKFPAFLYVRLKELFQPCPQSSRLPSILLLGILRGASREGPPLFLDQTEARRGRNFLKPTCPVPPPPYLRVWMIFEGLDPVLLASFSFPIWLTVSGYEPSRTDLTNRDIQSTKLKLNLNLLLFPNTQNTFSLTLTIPLTLTCS